MKTENLKLILDDRILFHEKEYWNESRLLDLPFSYVFPINNVEYQVELDFLERENSRGHIGISISDGRFWKSIFPKSSSFFVTIASSPQKCSEPYTPTNGIGCANPEEF